MRAPPLPRGDALRGLAQLAADATVAATDLVEAMHGSIARPWLAARSGEGPVRLPGLSGFVYGNVRATTRIVAGALDGVAKALGPTLGDAGPGPELDGFVAALAGVLGDHLAATGNPLAPPMELRHDGRRVVPHPTNRPSETGAVTSPAKTRVVVLVHGLCRSDAHWRRQGHDHGAALARDLGVSALYLRYNSGLHVSQNGRELATLLERLVEEWPTEIAELSIVGHSMGGLVARSACHYAMDAGALWPRRLRHLIFLGTPHHGAPLERIGRWVHAVIGAAPYARPLAAMGRIRSAGITDLRWGHVVDEHWQGRDRFGGRPGAGPAIPLPAGVDSWALAGVLGRGDRSWRANLVGDGLVPLASALGQHPDPAHHLGIAADRQWIAEGTGHLDLLASLDIYERLRAWLR